MSGLDEQIDEILDTVLWVGERWGASNVEGSNVPLLDEPPIQHTKQAKQAIKALIANQVREARIDGIKDYADALIDLFVNPPAEVGAAEDIHLHPWQIKNMILESLNHLDELKGDDK